MQGSRLARWSLLAAFGALVSATQALWLTYAPITPEAHRALGVSEGAIGDLAAINPLMYVLIAIPAGRWMDRRFGAALSAGALLTAGGALLRVVDTSSYAWALVGQVVLSIGQPFVLNATTKVAARYFPPAERTAAISVASVGQFAGILIAALSVPPLYEAGGMRLLLTTYAVFTVLAAAATLIALRLPPAYATEGAGAGSLRWLRHDPLLWRLAGLLFVGVGVFNAVATWLETILDDLGHPGAAGALIGLMTVTGIGGAAVLPGLASRKNRRRELLLASTVLTAAAFVLLALGGQVALAAVVLGVLGFVLLSGLPVALDWSELESGPERASTATAFLLLAGNLGGVVLVLVVQLLLGNPHVALLAISALALPGFFLALGLPRHARSHREDHDRPASAGLTV